MKKSKAWIYIVLWLLTFVFLGFSASILTEKKGLNLDLTENKLYSLSDETKEVVKQLAEPVEIIVLADETGYPQAMVNVLRKYETIGSELTVEFKDPYRNPKLIKDLTDSGLQVEENDIIIKSKDGIRKVSFEDCFSTKNDEDVPNFLGEKKITTAIDAVIHPERKQALFTDGHGEKPSESLINLLKDNHYTTGYAELSVEGISDDTSLLIICAPERDFSTNELSLIDQYMEKGKSVLLFLAPGSSGLINLSCFLNEWGIEATDEIVREPWLCLSGNELNIIPVYANHEINRYFENNRRYVISPSTAAIKQKFVQSGRTTTRPILNSSSDSYTIEGTKGPMILGISSVRTKETAKNQKDEEKLVVFGSALMYGDDLLSEDKLANSDFLLQTISWLDEDQQLINIPIKRIGSEIIPVTKRLTNQYVITMIVIFPVTILLNSLRIYLKRKGL